MNIQTYDSDLRPLRKNTLRHTGAPTIRSRPAVAVLHVWLLAWTRDEDDRIGLLVSRSRQPGYANQLALEVRSGSGVNMTTFQGQALLTWAGDEQQPGGHILRLP